MVLSANRGARRRVGFLRLCMPDFAALCWLASRGLLVVAPVFTRRLHVKAKSKPSMTDAVATIDDVELRLTHGTGGGSEGCGNGSCGSYGGSGNGAGNDGHGADGGGIDGGVDGGHAGGSAEGHGGLGGGCAGRQAELAGRQLM